MDPASGFCLDVTFFERIRSQLGDGCKVNLEESVDKWIRII